MQSLFAKQSLRVGAQAKSAGRSAASVLARHGCKPFFTRGLNFPIHGSSASFETGTNSTYFEEMHEQWKADPSSVHSSWRAYFDGLEKGVEEPFVAPPTLGHKESDSEMNEIIAAIKSGNITVQGSSEDVRESAKVMQLIQGYQSSGHVLADLDPLNLSETYSQFSNLARIYKKHT